MTKQELAALNVVLGAIENNDTIRAAGIRTVYAKEIAIARAALNTSAPAQVEQPTLPEPFMINGCNLFDVRIDTACNYLTHNTAFNGDAILAGWNELKRRALLSAAPPAPAQQKPVITEQWECAQMDAFNEWLDRASENIDPFSAMAGWMARARAALSSEQAAPQKTSDKSSDNCLMTDLSSSEQAALSSNPLQDKPVSSKPVAPQPDETCPLGCTGPEQGGSGCLAVNGECAMDAQPVAPDTTEMVSTHSNNAELLRKVAEAVREGMAKECSLLCQAHWSRRAPWHKGVKDCEATIRAMPVDPIVDALIESVKGK